MSRMLVSKRNMKHLKIVALLTSLLGSLVFVRACYLVGFSTGYGITEAERNSLIFRYAAIVCAVIFLGTGISLLVEIAKNRRAR